MMFRTKPKEKEPTIGDIAEGRDNITINYTRLRNAIKKCESDKQDSECRNQLKEMGITFTDE